MYNPIYLSLSASSGCVGSGDAMRDWCCRKGQVGSAAPETVQFIARCLEELDDVTKKATTVLKANDAHQEKLALLLRQGAPQQEIQRAQAAVFPPSIAASVRGCTSLEQIRQLTAPFRPPPRPTKAMQAREAGLGPLADALLAGRGCDITYDHIAQLGMADKAVGSQAILEEGLVALIAEAICKDATTFALLDALKPPLLTSQLRQPDTDTKTSAPFEMYFDFSMPVTRLKPHHVLAVNRGEQQKILRVSLQFFEETISVFEMDIRRGPLGAVVPARMPPPQGGTTRLFSHKQLSALLDTAIHTAWTQTLKVSNHPYAQGSHM